MRFANAGEWRKCASGAEYIVANRRMLRGRVCAHGLVHIGSARTFGAVVVATGGIAKAAAKRAASKEILTSCLASGRGRFSPDRAASLHRCAAWTRS